MLRMAGTFFYILNGLSQPAICWPEGDPLPTGAVFVGVYDGHSVYKHVLISSSGGYREYYITRDRKVS